MLSYCPFQASYDKSWAAYSWTMMLYAWRLLRVGPLSLSEFKKDIILAINAQMWDGAICHGQDVKRQQTLNKFMEL
jgi:hypothetical protein